ncbi:hypothetical protein Y1Q_0002662 [Alligator mississippiensis]|uniref:Uncharacterized protein n=1 Tax=Alligator mississippiensis TaxID=8496 RepID=A0A151NYZ4_ALLMI|nr:hypothetical protein Y1Q_0002662 [Alligator mississippiensis]
MSTATDQLKVKESKMSSRSTWDQIYKGPFEKICSKVNRRVISKWFVKVSVSVGRYSDSSVQKGSQLSAEAKNKEELLNAHKQRL